MLSKIKSVLAGLTPALPAEPPSPSPDVDTIAAQVTKKQKELSRGKAAAQVERLRADLAAAQLALTQAETAEGECLVDELDATAATEARRQASDHVRALEVALAVATEKDATALAELTNAERLVAEETKAAACARVLALTREGEEIFVHIKLFRVDLVRELENLREVGGSERFTYGINEIKAHLDFFMGLATRPASHDLADSGAFRKYPNWTACVEAVCGKAQP